MSGTAFISDFVGVAVGVPRMTWRLLAWSVSRAWSSDA
jgi:hypothetical protein